MSIVDPAGEDGVGSSTNGRVFLIVGRYLTEMCLGGGEDLVGKLQFGKIADDCDPDGVLGISSGGRRRCRSLRYAVCACAMASIELTRESGVWSGRLMNAMIAGDGWTLRTETHKVEDDAGAYGA